MNIYVLTSDKSMHIVEALQYTFNTYWTDKHQKVCILGYSEPAFELQDNFEFISLGEDNGPRVGKDLIDFFNSIDDKHFIFCVDDFPLISNIDDEMLEYAKTVMKDNSNIGRFGLTGDNKNRQHTVVDKTDNHEVIMNTQTADYKLSAVWSIWNKEYFLKYLTPSMNLWEWEIDGSSLSKYDEYEIMGTNHKYTINTCHIYKQGKIKPDWYESVWDKDIKIEEGIKRYIIRILNKFHPHLVGENI